MQAGVQLKICVLPIDLHSSNAQSQGIQACMCTTAVGMPPTVMLVSSLVISKFGCDGRDCPERQHKSAGDPFATNIGS